ncbi:hypothetical protein LZ30DRAFT_436255 [Colletotrichum cereale]|nr:hypothetical protein LZ30DRAFT_436255 [Colletotrichum cereale]
MLISTLPKVKLTTVSLLHHWERLLPTPSFIEATLVSLHSEWNDTNASKQRQKRSACCVRLTASRVRLVKLAYHDVCSAHFLMVGQNMIRCAAVLLARMRRCYRCPGIIRSAGSGPRHVSHVAGEESRLLWRQAETMDQNNYRSGLVHWHLFGLAVTF